jgi:hypothetical protein
MRALDRFVDFESGTEIVGRKDNAPDSIVLGRISD